MQEESQMQEMLRIAIIPEKLKLTQKQKYKLSERKVKHTRMWEVYRGFVGTL